MQLDTQRGNFVLKETRLIAALMAAANLEKRSSRAKAVLNWKDPTTKRAGHFAEVMYEVRSEATA